VTADDPRRSQTIGTLAVVGAVACFALSFSIVKWPRVPGSVIAWWRLLGSAVLWWILLVARRVRQGTPLPDRATIALVAPAALAFGLNISLIFLGVTRTSVAHSEFIAAMGALLLIPAGALFFGEHPNWRALRWGAVCLVGLIVVLANSPAGGEAAWEGDLIVVVAALAFCGYQLLSKRIRQRHVPPWDFMAVAMTGALITATPVAVATGGSEMWPLSAKAVTAIVLLTLMTGMLAHALLYYAQRHVPLSTIGIVQAGQPAQSAAWAWLLLGEAITAWQVPGMLLVTLGLALVVWSSRTAPATLPTDPGPG
jgi:drug/metabolite transporter (DMT)-like permease